MTSKLRSTTRYAGGLIAAAGAVVLAMTLNAGAASAATPDTAQLADQQTTSAQTPEECATQEIGSATSDAAAPQMTQLNAAATADAAATVSALAEQAGIAPNTPAEFIQQDGIKAYSIDVEGVTGTSVTFAIEGGGYVQPSNLTYVLDGSGALSQYSESTVIEGQDGLLDVTTYIDGALVQSEKFDPAAAEASALATDASAKAADPATCLMAVLGVSSVVAGIILVMCGGSCSVPVTPPTATICAACIGGIALVGGGSIAAVMGCFN